jgi:DNA-binding NtrC family response regulator
MARIALIDASGRAATTVEAVLGRTHELVVRKRIHAPGDVDLVIADLGADELMDPSTLRSLTSFGPVLLLVDKTQPVPVGIDESSDLSVLRKPFDAFELRILVDRLLLAVRRPAAASPSVAANREEEDAAWLEFPYVPAPAGAVLRRAARMSAALWIFGEPGCGRRRIATAVCRASLPPLRIVTLYPDEQLTTVLERESDGGRFALLVPEIEQRPLLEQERLAAVLSAPRAFRLIATSIDDPADCVIDGTFSRTLYQHLIGLAVQVSPLRERPLQIPPLVQALTRKVSRSLGIGDEISFSPDAMAKLQTYMWPGNLVELESVLNRTLAFLPGADADGRTIEADDLLFTPQDAFGAKPVDARTASVSSFPDPTSALKPEAESDTPQTGESGAGSASDEEPVDFAQIVAGLAHDLRNPMVAIKTFAGTISEDEAGGGLGALAGDACERIDGYLEALREFAEFEEPAKEKVQLASLLGEAVAELSADEPMRAVMDGGIDLEAACDPRQMRFVFENLLAAAVEEAAAGEAVRIRSGADRRIEFEARIGDGPSATLRKVLEAGARPVSWRILLARAIARRNGFSVDVDLTDAAMSIRCRLSGGEEQTRGQQTNRFSR